MAADEGLLEVRNITVSIRRAPGDVYRFISDGANLSRWATGLGTRIRRVGDEWLAEGPLGTAWVRLAPPNDFGVADHHVGLETGITVHNPIRVVPNGAGSTVIFTLMRLPGVADEKFDEDTNWIEKDLLGLKAMLERR